MPNPDKPRQHSPLSTSLTSSAAAMERLFKVMKMGEDICGRLTGTVPKTDFIGAGDNEVGAGHPGEDQRSMQDTASAQATNLSMMVVRLETVMVKISEAL